MRLESQAKLEPHCLATTLGSLPHIDVVGGTALMFEYTPEIPSWVQFPRRAFHENMLVQFTEGMPCLKFEDDRVYFDTAVPDYPEQLTSVARIVEDGVRAEGGDPLIGRKLRSLFRTCGLDADIGIHPGVWGIDKLREESDAEWRYLELTAQSNDDKAKLDELRPLWDQALKDGSMFQFNPVFYAFARKRGSHG